MQKEPLVFLKNIYDFAGSKSVRTCQQMDFHHILDHQYIQVTSIPQPKQTEELLCVRQGER
jgi:hypothetical protein